MQRNHLAEGLYRWFKIFVALLVLALALQSNASTRGAVPRVLIATDKQELAPGESYSIRLDVQHDGFVYLYSLDPKGYARLIFPTETVDGRGELLSGEYRENYPVLAGHVDGSERLVAVHTLEYRRIKPSRWEFLAPDPEDLEELNYRMTRSTRELDNYAVTAIEVYGPPEEEESVGISVHHRHHYDYWCHYCDCWHPTCHGGHCYCGWEVVFHYHGFYHYSHCFLWGSWHGWWRPPVVYVYIRGGSPYDYDTTPWRSRTVWTRHRHYSDRWRERVKPSIAVKENWSQIGERRLVEVRAKDIRTRLREAPQAPAGSEKHVWSTQQAKNSIRRQADPAVSTRPGNEVVRKERLTDTRAKTLSTKQSAGKKPSAKLSKQEKKARKAQLKTEKKQRKLEKKQRKKAQKAQKAKQKSVQKQQPKQKQKPTPAPKPAPKK